MERILFVFIAAVLASGWAGADTTAPERQLHRISTKLPWLVSRPGWRRNDHVGTTHQVLPAAHSCAGSKRSGVNSVIELNPDAIRIAEQMDDLRRRGKVLALCTASRS